KYLAWIPARASAAVAYRSLSSCCPRPSDPCRSRATSQASGAVPTQMCAKTCGDAIPSTTGREIRSKRRRPAGCGGAHESAAHLNRSQLQLSRLKAPCQVPWQSSRYSALRLRRKLTLLKPQTDARSPEGGIMYIPQGLRALKRNVFRRSDGERILKG